MIQRRASRVRLRVQVARLLALFALLLQCLSPVLVQAMPLMPVSSGQVSMTSHPPHCPHHAASSHAAMEKAPASHGQGLCCGTSHCDCAVSVAVVNEIHGLPLQGIDHPSPPEQSPATAPAFGTERLRPPDQLRNA